jgi:hypothetical protein
MLKEEILKKLKENNEVMDVVPGDYLGFFKRIGENKSVIKVMDVKPDYFIKYFDNSVDCLFFAREAFEIFNYLSKLSVLKSLNCEFDFKNIVFYSNNSKLLEHEQKGVISERKIISALDAINSINELIFEFEKKIGKKIILNIE